MVRPLESQFELQVRSALPSDYTRLSEIYLASKRATFTWLNEDHFQLLDFVKDTEGELILVAEANGVILGFTSSWLPEKFIHHLYLDPQHLRRRVGSFLLSETIKTIGSPARLKCATQNSSALQFYLSKGWKILEEGTSDDGPFYTMELPG